MEYTLWINPTFYRALYEIGGQYYDASTLSPTDLPANAQRLVRLHSSHPWSSRPILFVLTGGWILGTSDGQRFELARSNPANPEVEQMRLVTIYELEVPNLSQPISPGGSIPPRDLPPFSPSLLRLFLTLRAGHQPFREYRRFLAQRQQLTALPSIVRFIPELYIRPVSSSFNLYATEPVYKIGNTYYTAGETSLQQMDTPPDNMIRMGNLINGPSEPIGIVTDKGYYVYAMYDGRLSLVDSNLSRDHDAGRVKYMFRIRVPNDRLQFRDLPRIPQAKERQIYSMIIRDAPLKELNEVSEPSLFHTFYQPLLRYLYFDDRTPPSNILSTAATTALIGAGLVDNYEINPTLQLWAQPPNSLVTFHENNGATYYGPARVSGGQLIRPALFQQ